MDFNQLLNISNIDKEKVIREGIKNTRLQLNGLTIERTCLIYASYMAEYLKKQHVIFQLMDTSSDFDMDYQHFFIEVPVSSSNCYVIDLTYFQFGYDEDFMFMYKNGYQLLSSKMYQRYLNNIKEVTRNKKK